MEAEVIIVTRHMSLARYIKDIGLAPMNAKVYSFAKPEDVRDKDVIGILPYHIACNARSITEIKMRLPREKEGIELTMEEVEHYATPPKKYKVSQISEEE